MTKKQAVQLEGEETSPETCPERWRGVTRGNQMKKLLLSVLLLLVACSKNNPIEPLPDALIIPSPNVGFSATLYSVQHTIHPDTLSYYVLVTGTVMNRYDKPLFPVKTELRLYLSYETFSALTPDIVSFGKIGFFGDAGTLAGLAYTTDTLRVSQRMHHYTKSPEFYWFGSAYIYYDFRIVTDGVVKRESGIIREKDFAVPVTRRM